MDICVAQQFVVDGWLCAVGDAVTADHEDFADVVLPSPLTDIADLVGLEVDDNVYFVLFQSLVLSDERVLELCTFIVQFQVLAAPYLRTLPHVGSGVLHQCNVLLDAQQQSLEVAVELAFLPHAEEHPLETERGKVLPHLLAEF